MEWDDAGLPWLHTSRWRTGELTALCQQCCLKLKYCLGRPEKYSCLSSKIYSYRIKVPKKRNYLFLKKTSLFSRTLKILQENVWLSSIDGCELNTSAAETVFMSWWRSTGELGFRNQSWQQSLAFRLQASQLFRQTELLMRALVGLCQSLRSRTCRFDLAVT